MLIDSTTQRNLTLHRLLIIAGCLLALYPLYKQNKSSFLSVLSMADTEIQYSPTANISSPQPYMTVQSSTFRCDGRHCSQMTSRAEAEFFLRNCPNTRMDGDHDGMPCENDSRF